MLKTSLRREYKDKRRTFLKNLSESAYQDVVKKIERQLYTLLPPSTQLIGAFWPTSREINIVPLIESLRRQGRGIALPYVHDHQTLSFHLWNPEKQLQTDAAGMLSPDPDTLPVEPAYLLVPLLAFDPVCHRLGYGTGHYDRYFSQRKSPYTSIGIALEIQKHPELPIEAHDHQLDYVATEVTVYRKKK